MTRLVVVAFALALPVMWAVARYVQNQLYGLEPLDPATIAGAMAGLGSIAVIGALVPAMRAARVDPLVALREG